MARKIKARVLRRDEVWPDSRAANRAYWLSRPPEERIQEGKDLLRKIYWWMTGNEFPREMRRIVRPLHRRP